MTLCTLPPRHRRRLSLLAFCGALLLATASAPLPAQAPADEQAVLAVVQRLFDGMRTKDSAAIRALFEPGARLTSVRVRPDGTSRLNLTTVSQFISANAGDTSNVWNERMWSPEVRIDGTLATVWTEYDFHRGTRFSHCGYDAVQLLKTADGWRIVALADRFKATGCTRRDPPT